MSGPPRSLAALALVAAAAVAVTAAFLMIGGPETGRLARLDERRASDLVDLARAIERHRADTGRLPASLDMLAPEDVEGGPTGRPRLHDPETGEPYLYEASGEERFRICARLSLPETPPPALRRLRLPERSGTARLVVDRAGDRFCLRPALPAG